MADVKCPRCGSVTSAGKWRRCGRCHRFVSHTKTFEQAKEQFWGNVAVRGIDDCWLWTKSSIGHPPHGHLNLNIDGQRISMACGQAAWLFHAGFIPDGMEVLHDCNNAMCCNPSHLYPGTHLRNMQDAVEAGSMKGERNGHARFNAEQVAQIRSLFDGGMRLCEVARAAGMTLKNTWSIAHRKTWRHLP